MMRDGEKILLVDDDPDDLELYVDLFRSIDPNISTFQFLDPVEALAFLDRAGELPDLTILDFNMPKMTGLAFLQKVRGVEKLALLKVVVVTTGCNPRDAGALLDLGAECHRKSARFDEFKKLLQKILSEMS
jgi:CheY-like chemotaxis protein